MQTAGTATEISWRMVLLQAPGQCPAGIAALIKECMRAKPSDRPTAREIFDRMQAGPPPPPTRLPRLLAPCAHLSYNVPPAIKQAQHMHDVYCRVPQGCSPSCCFSGLRLHASLPFRSTIDTSEEYTEGSVLTWAGRNCAAAAGPAASGDDFRFCARGCQPAAVLFGPGGRPAWFSAPPF